MTMTPAALLTLAARDVMRPGPLKNSTTYGRAQMLSLAKVPGETGLQPDGTPSDAYFVRHAGEGEKGFLAYICDYEPGKLSYQVLSTEAKFCFTTTINGCTFTLGMPSGDGTLIVSHTNMRTTAMDKRDVETRGKTATVTFQGMVAADFHRHGTMLDSTIYWAAGDSVDGRGINVTVFGINDGGWKFYFQRWTFNSLTRVNKLLDLNAFATSSKTF
jgi:hypothetical protein